MSDSDIVDAFVMKITEKYYDITDGISAAARKLKKNFFRSDTVLWAILAALILGCAVATADLHGF